MTSEHIKHDLYVLKADYDMDGDLFLILMCRRCQVYKAVAITPWQAERLLTECEPWPRMGSNPEPALPAQGR